MYHQEFMYGPTVSEMQSPPPPGPVAPLEWVVKDLCGAYVPIV